VVVITLSATPLKVNSTLLGFVSILMELNELFNNEPPDVEPVCVCAEPLAVLVLNWATPESSL